MQGMSERQYAVHVGLSRGAIQKAKATGRLVLHEDGSIDAAASDKRRAETTDPSKIRKPPAPKLKPVPEAAVAAVGDTLREQGLTAPAVGGGTTFLQAKTANEVLKAQERRIRLQKLKGELVDRARAETLVFRLAREERDAWVNWPARVAAPMAAELALALAQAADAENGNAKPAVTTALIQRLLETHVRAQLESLAEVRPRLG
ncbi:hypothetical protein [Polymorphum gilvum]|uniref:Elements of external origin n=1 Tax=Polymorphum gilvum (strain LMG 25793 / CGMCC 1.9160 / SL003B-26A1) TaxID=991905 RepID=F2J6Q2_POLGS|nr:hypothetical protein [Polymorphum gilvum]ADZ72535.1 hypothetical protein SL003B_4119 [Polymorphum gilvum SL003B-26A1]